MSVDTAVGNRETGDENIHLKSRIIRFCVASVLLPAAVLFAMAQRGAPHIALLDQGWSEEIRQMFYTSPQGSRLMPYAWFIALEGASSRELFASLDNLRRYGWLYAEEAAAQINPLPIGFVKDLPDLPDTGSW